MKTLLLTFFCIGALALATGCGSTDSLLRPGGLSAATTATVSGGSGSMLSAPYHPPTGGLFTQVKAPLTIDYDNTKANPSKTGMAEANYIMLPIPGYWSFSWGDSSLGAAAAHGDIDTIEYADYEEFSILGIYRRSTVFVYGD